jgi:hypothetical protein
MPPTCKRRPGRGGGAAVLSLAGEGPQNNTAENGREDYIAALIAALELAAISCRPMTVDGRAPVHVRRVAGGYAIGLRP